MINLFFCFVFVFSLTFLIAIEASGRAARAKGIIYASSWLIYNFIACEVHSSIRSNFLIVIYRYARHSSRCDYIAA